MSEEVKFIFSMDDQFSKQAKVAENNVVGLEKKLGQLGGAVAAAFSISTVLGFGKAVFDSLRNYEYFHSAIKTMLHGNENAATALETQLIHLAKTTPFELTQIQDATKQLMAYGVQAGDVTETLHVLGDVTAGLGADKFPFIIRAFGQIKSKGHLAGQELNQLTEQGFNPLNVIMAKTGKSYATLLKEMEKGQISFKMVEEAFKSVTKEGGQFFNLMEEQSKTVGGKWSNLSDVWEQIKVDIGKSQSGILGGTISWISDMASALENNLSGSNRREAAYAKYGGKDFTWKQRVGSHMADALSAMGINISSKVNENEVFDETLQNNYVKNSKTKLQAMQNELKLQNLLVNQYKAYKEGDITKDELQRKVAIIKATQDQLKGIKDLADTKTPSTLGAAKDDAIKKEAAKVKTPHYTQINIDINEMIHEYKVTTQNSTEMPMITAEHVVRAMVQAVTDAQIVAGAN